MMLAVLAIGLVLVVFARRGVDVFSMALAGVVFYYYPILAFDNIVWLSEGVASSSVDSLAALVMFFIVVVYAVWAYFLPLYSAEKISFSGEKVLVLLRVSFVVCVVFSIVLLYKGRVYGGGSKVDLMAAITYELKIYESAATVYFICAHVLGGNLRRVIGVVFAVIALYIGFRFLVMSLVISYFIVRPVRNRKGVIYSGLGIFFVAVLSVVSKMFFYEIPDINMIGVILEGQLKGDDFFQNISIANAESSSVSVVFNEVLKNDFRVGFGYWVGVLISLIPAASVFGLGGVDGFADIYKSSLSVEGVETFAGSMFALGYAAFGYFGIILFVLAHLISMYFGYRFVFGRFSTYFKVFVLYFLVIAIFFGHRNDVIYNISLIKSVLGIVLGCVFWDVFLRAYFGPGAVSKWVGLDENRLPH